MGKTAEDMIKTEEARENALSDRLKGIDNIDEREKRRQISRVKHTSNLQRVLDLMYEELSKPYGQCRLVKWQKHDLANMIPVTLEPSQIIRVMEQPVGETGVINYGSVNNGGVGGVTSYFGGVVSSFPTLTQILAMVENHPLGKESNQGKGEVREEFRDALRKIDDVVKQNEFVLLEKYTSRGGDKWGYLRLMNRVSPFPKLYFCKSVPNPKTQEDFGYTLELVVDLSWSLSVDVDKNYIIPTNYAGSYVPWVGMSRSFSLHGYKLDPNRREKGTDCDNSNYPGYKVFTKDEINSVLKDALPRDIFRVIKRMMRDEKKWQDKKESMYGRQDDITTKDKRF